ncbi:MAG: hypothetical protein MAG794_00999 [Gammaproteobacteria bacterium]|nr:hypothetical protein [Gammaproteobacteria bacterium]
MGFTRHGDDVIAGDGLSSLLQVFLQSTLGVLVNAIRRQAAQYLLELVVYKCFCHIQPLVEVNGANDRLQGIRQDGLAVEPSAF